MEPVVTSTLTHYHVGFVVVPLLADAVTLWRVISPSLVLFRLFLIAAIYSHIKSYLKRIQTYCLRSACLSFCQSQPIHLPILVMR